MTSWPTRTEEQQEAFSKLCANFYEDGCFVCAGEPMKVVFTGPNEISIECFSPSGRQKITHVDKRSIDQCLLTLT